MSQEQIGEFAALATAVLWTLSALAWTSAGKRVGSLAVGFLRLVLAVGMLMAYGYFFRRGLALPLDAPLHVWQMLAVSGFLGFFVSDLCLFKAFLVIGPRLSLLVTSLTPLMTVLISWVWQGRNLEPQAWLGMSITLAGVLWVVLEQREGDEHPHSRKTLRYGLFLAFVATVAQSFGMVLAKDGIADYDPAASALIRIFGALIGYFLLITLLRRWRPIMVASRQRKPMLIVLCGTVVGPVVGVSMCMLALQKCHHVGIVTTILATIPVMILPFSVYLYGERVSVRAIGGAVVAAAGVALLMLPTHC